MKNQLQKKYFKIENSHIKEIRKYYENWSYNGPINLKFRYMKVLVFNQRKNQIKWIYLQRHVNKRRIAKQELGDHIQSLIEEKLFPIRVFHSITEWLAPHEIYKEELNHRIINPGFLVLENDTSLEESLKAAQILNYKLTGKKIFVYSGNKSIHTWWLDFNPSEFIEEYKNTPLAKKLEKRDRQARTIAFTQINNYSKYEFDRRSAVDSRRVVPIIGTLNGLTGRKVLEIKPDDIDHLNTKQIIQSSISH